LKRIKKELDRYDNLRKVIYFFPVQLFLVHLKKNQMMLVYWLVLFGFILQKIAPKYGIPYLFLNPEYLNEVNFWSYIIIGFGVGGFTMAFNISSYIMNAFRFPFLATTSNPFLKYCLNNTILPFTFIVVYCVQIYSFQIKNQFLSTSETLIEIGGFLLGVFLFLFLSISYFFKTNKDLFKMFGVKIEEGDELKVKFRTSRITLKKNMDWQAIDKNQRDWHVETYWSTFTRIRKARDFHHYDKEMLLNVFRQNQTNAALFEVFVVISLLLLGLFRENPFFEIPAGASILLLFTMYLMLNSAVYNWLRGWSTTVFFMILLIINSIFAWSIFNVSNGAYGLNYHTTKARYTRQTLQKYENNKKHLESDMHATIEILNNWRQKNCANTIQMQRKPKLVIINASGGGLRSALWTFYSLQYADSLLDGELLKHTELITGASGGMLGAAYLRELMLRKYDRKIKTFNRQSYIDNIAKDVLNPVVFAMTVNDLFLRIEDVKIGANKYKKDRAYALEQKINQNTNYILNKKLIDYAKPEQEANIPLMIFTPSILNDGKKLFISSQYISYMAQGNVSENINKHNLVEGIEFRRFFKNQDADSLLFTSAIRMSATFPFVSPVVSLPSNPVIDVVDAGGRDNYGVETSLKFLYTFRNWISTNTSGVVILQIRDRRKQKADESDSNPTLIQSITAPAQSLYDNLFSVQDLNQNALLNYAGLWFDGKIDVVDFELRNEKPDKISLSWHLTKKEKKKVMESIHLPENQLAFKRLKVLLEE
jgi:hypothetical protein